ncbi:50S ribosomal protein L21 [Okeania sp. SIO1H5]|uniref:50S ribosomal protein L21 n=1 Tax=Okeania sp. SIO1H5 TaxID=2607777 RepID=UPI00257C9840|nr:50S ribosomal protein L21 [Okeania sp. SIO1H5]
MYSIVKENGVQHKLTLGQTFKLPLSAAEVGNTLTFSQVLMASDGKEVSLGAPEVEGAVVEAEVLKHGRYPKVIVFKRKRRKGYRRTQGHKQHFTEVLVRSISAGSVQGKIDDKKAQRIRASFSDRPVAPKEPIPTSPETTEGDK